MEVVKLTDSTFEDAIKDGTVLVDVFTTWCGPCKMLAPIIAQAADECPNAKFCKVDAEECPGVSAKFNIHSVPTLLVFKDGKLVNTSVGVISKQAVIDLVS